MKMDVTLRLRFDAPAASDAWSLAQQAAAGAIIALRGCDQKRPDIVSVTADGRKVVWKEPVRKARGA